MHDGAVVFVAESGDEIVGMVEARDGSHVSLLHVSPDRHREGVARALMDRVDRWASERPGPASGITVNASPYAVPVYERFGFASTGPEQMKNGLRFVPMEKRLRATDHS